MSRRPARRGHPRDRRAVSTTSDPPPPPPTDRHSVREFIAATLGALLLTFVAFFPALHANFVSDDINAIVENEHVTGAFAPSAIVREFSWWGEGRSDSAGYRPGATLSFAINHVVDGDTPEGFRVVNFAMNALCAGLLFALARALGLGLLPGAAATAIYAVLPIHSEAAIWIVGRAELGATAAFLGACVGCLAHRRNGSPLALAAAAAAIAIGMTFKENAVTALAAPIFFFALLPREDGNARRDAMGFVALSSGVVAYALLRLAANGPAISGDTRSLLDNPLSVLDTGTRFLGALAVLGRYLALTFWPSSLSVDYSWDALGIGPGFRASGDSVVAVLFVGAAALAAWRGPGRRDIVAVGLLLAAASYSIVSNTVFVIGTILGERLFYLPTAGLCIAAAAMLEPVFASRSRRDSGTVAAAASLVAISVACILVDRRRSVDWMTPVSLFAAATETVPRSARAHMELASAYGAAGRFDEAESHFRTALEIKPDYMSAAYNEGNTLARAKRFDEAAAAYRHALAIDPRFTRAWHNLALTEKILGHTSAWAEAIEGAVKSSPPSPVLQNELGEALLAAGRYADAASAYDDLVASGSAVAVTWFNRGVARHHLGGCAAAVEDYRLAATAADPPREAFVAATGCLRELGRSDEAAALEQAAKVANRGTRR